MSDVETQRKQLFGNSEQLLQIHTDAIKDHLIPPELTPEQIGD